MLNLQGGSSLEIWVVYVFNSLYPPDLLLGYAKGPHLVGGNWIQMRVQGLVDTPAHCSSARCTELHIAPKERHTVRMY